MLYTGLKSDTWGTLTYGQQNSVYYDVVGVKTDIWDYDMIGQAPGNGINGDYDGSYRSRNMLKYKKTVGDVDHLVSAHRVYHAISVHPDGKKIALRNSLPRYEQGGSCFYGLRIR